MTLLSIPSSRYVIKKSRQIVLEMIDHTFLNQTLYVHIDRYVEMESDRII